MVVFVVDVAVVVVVVIIGVEAAATLVEAEVSLLRHTPKFEVATCLTVKASLVVTWDFTFLFFEAIGGVPLVVLVGLVVVLVALRRGAMLQAR
jgi:hypothetical protein